MGAVERWRYDHLKMSWELLAPQTQQPYAQHRRAAETLSETFFCHLLLGCQSLHICVGTLLTVRFRSIL